MWQKTRLLSTFEIQDKDIFFFDKFWDSIAVFICVYRKDDSECMSI